MSYFETGKSTQDKINESMGKGKSKAKTKAKKTKAPSKKKETQQQYFDRLRREAIERAKAAR